MKKFAITGISALVVMWLFGLLTPGADMINTALPSHLQQPGGLFGIGGSEQALQVEGAPDLYEEHRYLAELEAVHDGDTVTVIYGGQPIRVRLLGIDAPELDQLRGEDSRRYLKALTDNTVYIEPAGHDQFGRMLATLWGSTAHDTSINEYMVWGGMAYAFMTEDFSLLEAEAEALIAQRGVWGDENPVHPADWRAAQRISALAKQ